MNNSAILQTAVPFSSTENNDEIHLFGRIFCLPEKDRCWVLRRENNPEPINIRPFFESVLHRLDGKNISYTSIKGSGYRIQHDLASAFTLCYDEGVPLILGSASNEVKILTKVSSYITSALLTLNGRRVHVRTFREYDGFSIEPDPTENLQVIRKNEDGKYRIPTQILGSACGMHNKHPCVCFAKELSEKGTSKGAMMHICKKFSFEFIRNLAEIVTDEHIGTDQFPLGNCVVKRESHPQRR